MPVAKEKLLLLNLNPKITCIRIYIYIYLINLKTLIGHVKLRVTIIYAHSHVLLFG